MTHVSDVLLVHIIWGYHMSLCNIEFSQYIKRLILALCQNSVNHRLVACKSNVFSVEL